MSNYNNGYRSGHSNYLNGRFKIGNRGVDHYNLNNVSFEFKETFAKDIKKVSFRIPKKQLEESLFVVFSVHNREFYVVRSSEFLMKYFFRNRCKKCYPTVNIVKDLSFYETNNLDDLEEFIDKLDVNDV
ncbi:hypothetical protein LCGC14_1173890 [marine sediment metagenome]|uniref:Uncharacterized protein n=1 Tax=marine sediment metagenome TaxID=412755 RepID=A0A0F9LTY5_9ZZZZ